ncbi:MAG: CHASE domain-containing protein, partial [Proteobacteria bacterium]|nr:CHASE domain-containing protein [Pseudomonadota bacterium]
MESSPIVWMTAALRQVAVFALGPAALIVLTIGMASAIGAWHIARWVDDTRIERAIQIRIDWRTRDIESKLHSMTAPIIATAAYLRTNSRPSAGEFRRFVREMALGDSALLSVLWAPLLPQAERAAFEMMAYRIVDASGASARLGDEYLPVHHIETFGRQTVPVGLDLWTDPTLAALIENARRVGAPSVTPAIELIGPRGTAPL